MQNIYIFMEVDTLSMNKEKFLPPEDLSTFFRDRGLYIQTKMMSRVYYVLCSHCSTVGLPIPFLLESVKHTKAPGEVIWSLHLHMLPDTALSPFERRGMVSTWRIRGYFPKLSKYLLLGPYIPIPLLSALWSNLYTY